MAKKANHGASEIDAIGKVFEALRGIDSSAQNRVLRYVAEMLGLRLQTPDVAQEESSEQSSMVLPHMSAAGDAQAADEAEGINSVALKWMKRSGLHPKGLQNFFSLGIDDIDLVAKLVPGDNKKERMRSVLLLKAIAAYLSTGVPRGNL